MIVRFISVIISFSLLFLSVSFTYAFNDQDKIVRKLAREAEKLDREIEKGIEIKRELCKEILDDCLKKKSLYLNETIQLFSKRGYKYKPNGNNLKQGKYFIIKSSKIKRKGYVKIKLNKAIKGGKIFYINAKDFWDYFDFNQCGDGFKETCLESNRYKPRI